MLQLPYRSKENFNFYFLNTLFVIAKGEKLI